MCTRQSWRLLVSDCGKVGLHVDGVPSPTTTVENCQQLPLVWFVVCLPRCRSRGSSNKQPRGPARSTLTGHHASPPDRVLEVRKLGRCKVVSMCIPVLGSGRRTCVARASLPLVAVWVVGGAVRSIVQSLLVSTAAAGSRHRCPSHLLRDNEARAVGRGSAMRQSVSGWWVNGDHHSWWAAAPVRG